MEEESIHKYLIKDFYSAMQEKDAEKMNQCYHKDIEFYDPAFGKLNGPRAGHMWSMLMSSQKDKEFRVEYSDLQENNGIIFGRLDVYYGFGKRNRPVHNIIHSEFHFSDGKIIKHTDRFNLYRWSRQAMGMTGVLLGWTPWFQNKMKVQSNRVLDKWLKKNTNHE